MMEAALAALLTCLCDPGGPIRRRMPSILAFGLLGATVTVGIRRCSATRRWPGDPAGLRWACSAPASRACLGQAGDAGRQPADGGAGAGAATRTITDWRTAAELGGMFVGRQPVGALLTLVIWRIYPYPPRPPRASPMRSGRWRRLVHDLRRRWRIRARTRPSGTSMRARIAARCASASSGARGACWRRCACAWPIQRAGGADLAPAGGGRPDLRRADRPVGTAGRRPRPGHARRRPTASCGCCGHTGGAGQLHRHR